MLHNVDKSGGRCARCDVLLHIPTSYITSRFTPYSVRDDYMPAVVVRERQCARCNAGSCAATLYHVAERCTRPRTQGNATCEVCAETIKNVMQNTLQRYGL